MNNSIVGVPPAGMIGTLVWYLFRTSFGVPVTVFLMSVNVRMQAQNHVQCTHYKAVHLYIENK